MNSSIQPYLSQVFELTKCEEVENTLCTVDTESIQGKYVQSLEDIKKLVAKYYIAIHLFYEENSSSLFYVSSGALSVQEPNVFDPNQAIRTAFAKKPDNPLEYINEIMQFNEVICCIEKETGYKYNNYQITMANFNINVTYTNQAPTVGSYSTLNVDANSQSSVVLTSAFFTTDTSPAYNDPEGDAPYKLKILSLPAEGTLKLNGVAVSVNDEILFTDIDNSLLTYDVTGLTYDVSTSFTFAISDTGSQNFSS